MEVYYEVCLNFHMEKIMLQRCACNAFDVEANDCTHVRNGKPMCPMWICEKVKDHRDQHLHYPAGGEYADETE